MAYYKIKNITNSLAKRHDNKNKTLDITYNVGFNKKTYILPVGGEMIISCMNLPVNIQTLRIKQLVTVKEISENEFLKSQRPNAKKQEPIPVTKTNAPKKVTKKPVTKKTEQISEVEEKK